MADKQPPQEALWSRTDTAIDRIESPAAAGPRTGGSLEKVTADYRIALARYIRALRALGRERSTPPKTH